MLREPFKIQGENFWLSHERTIFWEEEKALIISDLHFGKTGHFRKLGIGVPQDVFKEDLHRLVNQIVHFRAEKIIIVGDLFHSNANKELELFVKWRKDFNHIRFILVKGNHDILENRYYEAAGIEIFNSLTIRNFYFCHDPEEAVDIKDNYLFSGHIHPAVTLSGPGKQSLRFPCFYFSSNSCILPAFSKFTGCVSLKPDNGGKIIAIVKNELVPLN